MLVLPHLLHVLWILSSVVAREWDNCPPCEPCRCTIQERNNSKWVKQVDCSRTHLDRVPANLPYDLEWLDMSYNTLTTPVIPSLCDFKFLRFLSLAFNPLIGLGGNEFLKCFLLVELNLTGNSIVHLKHGSFVGLRNIQELHGLEVESVEEGGFNFFNNLKILEFVFRGKAISEQTFTGLQIRTLNLTLGRVTNVPRGLFAFGNKTLQVLYVQGPEVAVLPGDILRGLTLLRKVSLHLPSLMTLPKLFRNLGEDTGSDGPRGLHTISLSGMASIPSHSFSRLESVVRLGIHDVHDIAVDGLFADLVSLETLNLTDSTVVRIPPRWFTTLHRLYSLDIGNTTLRSLEADSFNGLLNLRELDVSLNVLRILNPKSFDPLRKSIRILRLRGNILKTIDDGLLNDMTALNYLDLSDNKLSAISPNAFADLRALKSLQLQENKLYFLPKNLFRNQHFLKTLHLGSNYFSRVPLAVKGLGTSLRFLFLPDNKITTVPISLPYSVTNLKYISLRDNPIFCHCRIFNLRRRIRNLFVDAVCAGPHQYSGRHVMHTPIPDNCPRPRTRSGWRRQLPSNRVPSFLPTGLGQTSRERMPSTEYIGKIPSGRKTVSISSVTRASGLEHIFHKGSNTRYTHNTAYSTSGDFNAKLITHRASGLVPTGPVFITTPPIGQVSHTIVTRPIPSDAMIRPDGVTAPAVVALFPSIIPSSSRQLPICGSDGSLPRTESKGTFNDLTSAGEDMESSHVVQRMQKDPHNPAGQLLSSSSDRDCEDRTGVPEVTHGNAVVNEESPDVAVAITYLGILVVPTLLTAFFAAVWWRRRASRRRLYEVSPTKQGDMKLVKMRPLK